MNSNYKNRIQAVSLASLIIGMAIGTFIIVSMLQLFTSARASYRLANNLEELNTTLRYAEDVMTKVISQAGYRPTDGSSLSLISYTSAFPSFSNTWYGDSANIVINSGRDPAATPLRFFNGGTVIPPVSNLFQNQLWSKFRGSPLGNIRSCIDLYGDANNTIKVLFYSRIVDSSTGEGGYYCENQFTNTDYTYTNGVVTGSVLIPPEIYDSVYIRYGEDITSTYASPRNSIDRWSIPSYVLDWSRVYAVRVSFIAHTRDDVRDSDVTQTFKIFGINISRTSKKIYKMHTFTIMLPHIRNSIVGKAVLTP